MKIEEICTKNYAIITHSLFTGIGHDLYKFLKQRNANYVLLVEHSFSSAKDRRTTFTYLANRGEHSRKGFDYKLLPDSIVYIKDFLYSFFGILLNKKRFDVIFGCGGFNAYCALLLRQMGKCETVIFYTIDYVPNRFGNALLNKFYHHIDKICVKCCDETWNLSPRMAEGREKHDNMLIKEYNRQKVVPVGIWLDDLPKKNKKYERKTLVFVGHLLEKQGVQLVLRAVPKIIKKIKEFQFIVIGTGEYEPELKKIVKELRIEEQVCFKGPIHDPPELNQILGKCHLAIAMYDKKKDTFTYYADPTKLKTYLAMGLPILLTDVPHNAADIECNGCGKIIRYDVESVSSAIIEIMNDNKTLEEYSRNATRYIKQFDWNDIFTQNIEGIQYVGN